MNVIKILIDWRIRGRHTTGHYSPGLGQSSEEPFSWIFFFSNKKKREEKIQSTPPAQLINETLSVYLSLFHFNIFMGVTCVCVVWCVLITSKGTDIWGRWIVQRQWIFFTRSTSVSLICSWWWWRNEEAEAVVLVWHIRLLPYGHNRFRSSRHS